MRGKSELKQEGPAANQTSSGLDRDYITNWSYGIGETLTLLVPNVKGGGCSTTLSQNETAMAKANPMYGNLYSQLTPYFGDQPWTAGPVYVGAFVVLLKARSNGHCWEPPFFLSFFRGERTSWG